MISTESLFLSIAVVVLVISLLVCLHALIRSAQKNLNKHADLRKKK